MEMIRDMGPIPAVDDTLAPRPPEEAMAEERSLARSAPLAMGPGEFRRVGNALVDALASLLGSVPDGPVARDESPGLIRETMRAARPLPAAGTDAGDLLRETTRFLAEHSLFNAHPRFFGYITSPPAPIGILGDFLAAALNANVGAWRLAPAASEIEAQAVRWIAELIGYPPDCGGLFVSGGNMANTVALLAARAAAAGWDVRRQGMMAPVARPFRVYASRETHTWIQKATDLAGIGTDAIGWLPTDGDQRLDTAALRAALEEDRERGFHPLMVVGTAGSVSTGAVDPLHEIAAICQESKVWFHVDGAYGAVAAAVPGTPHDLGALHCADSVAVDPHKWLYAPLEAGCVLVRDPEALRGAFAYHPPYYHFGEQATNYVDLGPQNSRGFRALKVWLALQHAGREGYVRMIGDDIALAAHLRDAIVAHPALELFTQGLSIVTFRYVPDDLRAEPGDVGTEAYLDELNQALLERIQTSGEAFVSNAVVSGRYLLRACIVNFHTTFADVEALPDIVARWGSALDAELRPPVTPVGS